MTRSTRHRQGLRHRLGRKLRMLVSRSFDLVYRPRRTYNLDPTMPPERLLDAPLIAWLNYHQHAILGKQCYWLGHRALKNPLDAWIYQEVLFEVKPDVVIEIGNKNGGSTLFLASILELLGHGEILAVDLDHTQFTATHQRITLITGDCSAPAILGEVRSRCAGKRTLVIHDADHSRDAVLRDLRNFAPLVSAGSYLIVEDSVQGLPGFSGTFGRSHGDFFLPDTDTPLQAIDAFLAENRDFAVDATRERYLLTSNPRGFLKRASPP